MTEATAEDLQRAEAQRVRNTRRMMATSNRDNDGQSTFVDYSDLHPTNAAAEFLSGATKTGVTAGVLTGAVGVMLMTAGTGSVKRGDIKTAALLGTGITLVSAAIGGVISYMRAKTHNQWSEKILAQQERKEASRLNAQENGVER